MVVVMKERASEAQIDSVIARLIELGMDVHRSSGATRTVLGVVGAHKVEKELIEILDGVHEVLRITEPYKRASRTFKPEDTIITMDDVRIGGDEVIVMAGPCSAETEEQVESSAAAVKRAGAKVFRGGAFKPRSSPYSFQGLGEDGLKILKETGERFGMPVVTEVMDPRQVDLVERYTDIMQVGARNMQNFDLLKEVGRTRTPVLLKRGMSATVKDLLMSAEYVLAQGNRRVILCERGVRTFEDSTRNTLDLSIVPNVQGLSHLPIIVDPSHATGRPDLIPSMARAAVASGCDGVHIEVHSCPEKALSDGPQALLPRQYAQLMDELRQLAEVLGRSIDACEGVPA
jgi:3-deoxy-7-phosphoheptulonate synthase